MKDGDSIRHGVSFTTRGKIIKTVERFQMLSAGDNIIVALSGGADSVAMLLLLLSVKDKYQLSISAVHINHSIRKEADSDEQFCKKLCGDLNVLFITEKINIPLISKTTGESVELAARNERYRIFDALIKKNNCKIATAHNLNDNAENMIMALLRSKSQSSLDGIPQVRGKYIRPMLELSRSDILAYLTSTNKNYVQDKTNDDENYTRNYVRKSILPLMLQKNPNLLSTLYEMSNNVKTENDFFSSKLSNDDNSELSVVKRNIAKQYYSFSNGLVLNSALLNNIAAAVNKNGTKFFSLPNNHTAIVCYNKILFVKDKEIHEKADKKYPETPLTYGENILFDGQIKIIVSESEIEDRKDENFNNFSTIYTLDSDKIQNGAIVGSRQSHDKITIRGINRSVKKMMIDLKIPLMIRNLLPVIKIENQIALIPFLGIADGFCNRENSKKTYLSVKIKFEDGTQI